MTATSGRYIKAQLYGEYLHAFEDTFAHRDQNNKPYDRVNLNENSPPGGLGHGLALEYPDHTYNDGYWQSTGPVADSDNEFVEWKYNELRSLEMEKEVFELFQRDFATEIAENPKARRTTWQELAGAGAAPIGVAGKPGDVASRDIGNIMQKFNAEQDNEKKIAMLQGWLAANGFEVPNDSKSYKIEKGSENRSLFLGDRKLDDSRFEGVMLPALWER